MPVPTGQAHTLPATLVEKITTVMIVEDEAVTARRLERLVRKLLPCIEDIFFIESLAEGQIMLAAGYPPGLNLIFSDIELGDGQSFTLFRQQMPPCPVIFCTAYNEFALQAFEANGIAYLLKPVEESSLHQAISRLGAIYQAVGPVPTPTSSPDQAGALLATLQQLARSPAFATKTPAASGGQRFLLKFGDRLIPLDVEKIHYFSSQEKTVIATTSTNEHFPMDLTLDELEEQLAYNGFFRINRSCLCHHRAIKSIFSHFSGRLKLTLAPATEKEVFVPKERVAYFKDWITGGPLAM